MPRPLDQLQVGPGDPAGEQRGVGHGVEPVLGAVQDERVRADGGQHVPGVVPVAGQQMAPPGVPGHGAVAERRVRTGVGGRPAGGVHQVDERAPDLGGGALSQRAAYVVAAFHGVRPAGRGAAQHQRPHPVRVRRRHPLGHPAAHGRPVDVGPSDAECVQHGDHIAGEPPGAVRHIGLVTVTRPAPVEGDGTVRGGEVRAHRVPPPVAVGLPGEQYQRLPGAGHLIRDPDLVCGNGELTHSAILPHR
ncbi:hypothetical protein SXIM_37870 [Streptomyces xiamenensis]|uniref:Uncharacterized protein n=1 Tax=Streptomyces xiamenensis TaxID=408015 RepID=A0A0F7CPS5_9ACTN|nr:hypothetical protein SXIM_37870 [Streptomyces xiamenensis]